MYNETHDYDKIFFTSDLHFFHANILKWASKTRKGSDVFDMNNQIIEEWNKKVPSDGLVYLLGDVSWKSSRETNEILYQLNGRICLIAGNHDESNLRNQSFRDRFEWVRDYSEVKINNRKIIMMHYPIESWKDKDHDSWHLHGHLHGNTSHECQEMKNRLDIGIDNRYSGDMQVWSLGEIKIHMENQRGI